MSNPWILRVPTSVTGPRHYGCTQPLLDVVDSPEAVDLTPLTQLVPTSATTSNQ